VSKGPPRYTDKSRQIRLSSAAGDAPPQLSKEVLLYPVDFLTVSVACSALMIVRTTILIKTGGNT
jgi:hypothetical protein